jgi:hypothetical protein
MVKHVYNIKYSIKILILYVQEIESNLQYANEKYGIRIIILAFKVQVCQIVDFVNGNYATHER